MLSRSPVRGSRTMLIRKPLSRKSFRIGGIVLEGAPETNRAEEKDDGDGDGEEGLEGPPAMEADGEEGTELGVPFAAVAYVFPKDCRWTVPR